MSRLLPDVLNTLLAEGRFSAEDLAALAGCSANMIYRVRNEDADLSFAKAQALSLGLCRQREHRVALTMVTPDLRLCDEAEARVNGSLDDEASELFMAFGATIEHFRSGDTAAMLAALGHAERALTNARAEAARL